MPARIVRLSDHADPEHRDHERRDSGALLGRRGGAERQHRDVTEVDQHQPETRAERRAQGAEPLGLGRVGLRARIARLVVARLGGERTIRRPRHHRGECRGEQRQNGRGDPHARRVGVTGQRLRQRRPDREARVVGEPDVAHRAPAPLGAREPEQPQHGRRHHHRLAGADGQPAQDQDGERLDERRDRPRGHHQRADDHDPRRPTVIGEPSSERAARRARERGRADREAHEDRAATERVHVVREDPEHRAERGVAQDCGGQDDEVSA